MAFAPTRSGKGVGLVVPTLLTWPGSAVIHDIKGENWEVTAGWDASADAPASGSIAAGRHHVSRGNFNISQAAVAWGRYAEASRRQAIALEPAGAGKLPRCGGPPSSRRSAWIGSPVDGPGWPSGSPN